jgi:fatty-acid desaturase
VGRDRLHGDDSRAGHRGPAAPLLELASVRGLRGSLLDHRLLRVTIGYHRLLCHRSFQVPQWLERFFATCGALSCQHGPIDWVGLHRHHHKFSDTDADHHDSNKGFWWSHMGWMLEAIPATAAVPRLTGDLARDPYYRWLNTWFMALQLPLALLLFWIGSVTGAGGWALVLWGIPLRLVVVYHFTWLVNSATHMWGYTSHDSGDAVTQQPLGGGSHLR